MKKTNPHIAVCIALTLSFFGCHFAPKPDGLPKLLPFTLTLTQDGVPLAGASVSLFADDGVSAWTVGGTTDAAGKISPVTHGKYPGIPAGQYKVCVRKIEADLPAESEPSANSKLSLVNYPEYDLVDVTLQSPATTTLVLQVERGKKKITLDVGKPVRVLIGTD